jgi:gas vesicle protein
MGFLAGAAAGAIAGILFAPDKGSSTRRKLKSQVLAISDEYGLGINEMIDDLGIGQDKKPKSRPAVKKPRAPRKTNNPSK